MAAHKLSARLLKIYENQGGGERVEMEREKKIGVSLKCVYECYGISVNIALQKTTSSLISEQKLSSA